jgi:hypothetical protein
MTANKQVTLPNLPPLPKSLEDSEVLHQVATLYHEAIYNLTEIIKDLDVRLKKVERS